MQERFDIHRMGGAAAVARAVGGAGANLIHRLPSAPTAEAGTVTLQLPELSVVALYAVPFNITVTVVPVARPLEPPLMVRSRVFSALLIMSSPETILMVSVGPLRSTVTLWVVLSLLPARSLRLAVIVWLPVASAVTSAAGMPTLQLPEASSVVV